MNELKEGEKLQAVVFAPDADGDSTCYRTDPKRPGMTCESITVREQRGQQNMVPWAEIVMTDGKVVLANLAHMETVVLQEPNQTPKKKLKCEECGDFFGSQEALEDHTRDKHSILMGRHAEPNWDKRCENCDAVPIHPATGLCGPCTFGEAATAGGRW